jgi:hypothetical protein
MVDTMEFFDFEWPRDEAGYQIDSSKPRKRKREVTLLDEVADTAQFIKSVGGPTTKIRPLDHFPNLFLKFASTPKTTEAISEFAGKFGLLRGIKRESIDSWYSAIDNFKTAVSYQKDGFWGLATGSLEAAMPKSFSAVLSRREGNKLPSLLIRPTTLYAAMWLQYAFWVSAPGVQYRSCDWCSEPFLYGPGTGRRSSARYCQPKCQKAHSYDRRK